MELLFMMMAAHALGDFGLQTDWLAIHKNRHVRPAKGSKSQRPDLIWIHVLTSHALIHGGLVALVTGYWWLGLAETVCHWIIDFLKCDKKFGFHTDQFLHIGCKFVWLGICLSIA